MPVGEPQNGVKSCTGPSANVRSRPSRVVFKQYVIGHQPSPRAPPGFNARTTCSTKGQLLCFDVSAVIEKIGERVGRPAHLFLVPEGRIGQHKVGLRQAPRPSGGERIG